MIPPHNIQAEEALLGACLVWPSAVEWAVEWITPSDFYVPANAEIFDAIARLYRTGGKVDAVSVHDALRDKRVDAVRLASLTAGVPSAAHVQRYGEIVQRHSVARSALTAVIGAEQELEARERHPAEVVDELAAALKSIDNPLLVRDPGDMSLRSLLIEDLEEHTPWVIPELMRIDWRCMFVGIEGGGRSVLLRQLAIATAYGVHPFWNHVRRIEPQPSLIIDLENPRKNVQEWSDKIHQVAERQAGNDKGRDLCRVWLRPEGINLRSRVDRAELEDILRRHRPTLVCCGPLYKAYEPDSSKSYEESARGLQDVFDNLRTRYGFALVLEHHAPNGDKGDARDMRPEGSSLWRRWGELRWKLLRKKDVAPYKDRPEEEFPVKAMRRQGFSGDRVQHQWPNAFFWGGSGAFPWQGYWDNAPSEEEEEF